MEKTRLYNLKDIDPKDQKGGYADLFDVSFEKAADKWKVPFALLKAHAIRESSLNPKAFVNENPKNLSTRQGWASRGLMQVLWWPGSNRFVKYGYTDDELDNGSLLFEPDVNCDIAAQIIKANLIGCGGNLRDAINMYNTGKKESQIIAPNNYVNDVLKYYYKIIGE